MRLADDGCLDIVVPDGWMSSRHAELAAGAGGWTLTDLHARNGTWVNSARVPGGGAARVADGDLLQLGHTFFRFLTELAANGPPFREARDVEVGKPGRPRALGPARSCRVPIASSRGTSRPRTSRKVAPVLYGGAARDRPELLRQQGHLRFIRPPSVRGYLWQLAAGIGWTSLPWLHRLKQPVLVLAADDDPIIPLINARIIARLVPKATLEVVPRGGHLFLLTHAEAVAPRIAAFLRE